MSAAVTETKSIGRCLVCNGSTRPYFAKDFGGQCGLRKVEYRQCTNCGFAYSATHYGLSQADWSEINRRYHVSAFDNDDCEDDPRWRERMALQCDAIERLHRRDLLATDLRYYDYGAGHGKLSQILAARGIKIEKYEKYLKGEDGDYLSEEEVERGGFGLVVTTSVVEHLMDRVQLDLIANSVDAKRGVFAVHTWVGNVVPPDPDWFYLLPVHVSFYTNESMRILLLRWGFVASVYIVEARIWFLFRSVETARAAFRVLGETRSDVYFAEGFADYWR
jgi:hypothetical protein